MRCSCFEFPMERWVEHVSLLFLSGRELLCDKAAREWVLAEATHLAGGVCGILLWVRSERIVRGMEQNPNSTGLISDSYDCISSTHTMYSWPCV